jgi:hypothetical protein
MSNQREWHFDEFRREVRELKGRMEQVLPSYLSGLEKLSQLPEDFNHRFWVSCLDALLAKVKGDYQKWQAQAQKADLLGKFMTLGVDVVLKAGGMEPIAPPSSARIGICVSPSGRIEPALFDDPNRKPDVILITFEEFEAIAQRLKGEILKGTVVPKSEDEISRLIYVFGAEQK